MINPNNKNKNIRKYLLNKYESTLSSQEVHITPLSNININKIEILNRKLADESINPTTTKYDIFNIDAYLLDYLKRNENKNIVKQYKMFTNLLNETIIGYDPNLPKIRVYLSSNESIVFSWRIGKTYFGVSIFEDENDSCWTLIQKGPRGYESDGYLNDPNLKKQLPVILNLVKSNL